MPIKQYKKHGDVNKKYKWDLSFLLGKKSAESAMKEILELMKKDIKIKDSKYKNSETYLKYRQADDKNLEKYFKFINYLSNSIALNVVDPTISALQQKFQYESYMIAQELGPEDPRFFKNAKKLARWAKLPKFASYKKSIEDKLDTKKHQLPKEIQEFRAKESRADISAEEIFGILTNSELDYGFATTTGGKKIEVTPANRIALSKHKDAKVRKTSAISFRNAFLKHKGTLSSLLFQHFKKATTWAKLRNFDSTIDSLIYNDKVDVKLLKTLYKSVQDNMPAFRKADAIHKKFYKAKFGKAMTRYDRGVELVKTNGEYSPEAAMKLVADSFKPFGKEYHEKVKEGFKNNWVDFMPIKNKRSGAYSIGGSYSLDKKLIFLNFNGTFGAVETLAHEMGHSMHSYFSDSRNDITNSQYPIFVAEVASIFNELMLFDHVLKTTKNDKLKFEIRQQMAQGFEGTVLRQVQWSNYEFDMYTAIENGQPLSSFESISKVYYENAKKYAIKPNKKYKEEDQFASVYVPHYYYGFYVYKYAIGQLVANVFFQKYKEEGKVVLENYIKNFLSAGCKLDPVETLKAAGVDLHDPKTYEVGFKAHSDNLKEWEKLGKKIFKIK